MEGEDFTASIPDYFGTDDRYRTFQAFLMENPEAGDVMPGCGGIRKVRWVHPQRGKGKRSGLRVIYLLVPEFERIVLLEVYDKNEMDDLDSSQRRELAELAEAYRKQLKRAARPQRRRR